MEARDRIDVLECDARIQGLANLAWAACGKDPGFSPAAILEQATRSARYSSEEVAALAFAGDPPNAAELARRWHQLLARAREVVSLLPGKDAGRCVLSPGGVLRRAKPRELEDAF